jgi:hypothetical protein
MTLNPALVGDSTRRRRGASHRLRNTPQTEMNEKVVAAQQQDDHADQPRGPEVPPQVPETCNPRGRTLSGVPDWPNWPHTTPLPGRCEVSSREWAHRWIRRPSARHRPPRRSGRIPHPLAGRRGSWAQARSSRRPSAARQWAKAAARPARCNRRARARRGRRNASVSRPSPQVRLCA